MKRSKNNKNELKKIAEGRIERLFSMAKDSVSDSDVSFSKNCIKHAREIALKHQISLKGEKRRLVCRKCGEFLYPGVTCDVRLRDGKLIYHCKNCKNYNKFVYKK